MLKGEKRGILTQEMSDKVMEIFQHGWLNFSHFDMNPFFSVVNVCFAVYQDGYDE